jgi:hypothetical protein
VEDRDLDVRGARLAALEPTSTERLSASTQTASVKVNSIDSTHDAATVSRSYSPVASWRRSVSVMPYVRS